jgi:hypothetical protein
MSPWLGGKVRVDGQKKYRLLIHTASNAYFPQVLSVLTLPDRRDEFTIRIRKLWDDLHIVHTPADLSFTKENSAVAGALVPSRLPREGASAYCLYG